MSLCCLIQLRSFFKAPLCGALTPGAETAALGQMQQVRYHTFNGVEAVFLANEYATKRYRSNLINWGLLPLRTEETLKIPVGSYLLIRDVRNVVSECKNPIMVQVLDPASATVQSEITCTLDALTEDERKILLSGCLINYYRG